MLSKYCLTRMRTHADLLQVRDAGAYLRQVKVNSPKIAFHSTKDVHQPFRQLITLSQLVVFHRDVILRLRHVQGPAPNTGTTT